jgi:hypothetical protein
MSHKLYINMPLEVHFRPYPGKYLRRNVGSALMFRYRRELGSRLTKEQRDPWAVRQAFLDADPAHFPDFIARYGKFARHAHDLHPSPDDEHFAGETNFTKWQMVVRKALTTPKDRTASLKAKYFGMAWMLFRRIPIEIKWRGGSKGDSTVMPVGVVRLGCVLDAIAFSIQYDHLQGHTNRYCARPDCGKIFLLGYRREKIYCSIECAHVMAVRKSRARVGNPKPRKDSNQAEKPDVAKNQ